MDRSKYIDPLKFLVLVTPLFIFLSIKVFPDNSFLAGIIDGQSSAENRSEKEMEVLAAVSSHFINYFHLIYMGTVPLFALLSHFVYRKYQLSFGEHLTINTFLYSFLTAVMIVFMPLQSLSPVFISFVLFAFQMIYFVFFFKRIFKQSWQRTVLNTSLITLLSLVAMMITLVLYLLCLLYLHRAS